MSWSAAAVGVAGPLIQSISGGILAKYQADRSHGEAEWASRESQGFAERMSSTAHRREVDDLRAAGLNPILSVAHGGASTPTAMTSPGHVPDFGAHAPRFSSDALSLVNTLNSLRSTNASIRNMDASTAASKAQSLKTMAEIDNISSARDVQESQAALNKELRRLRGAEADSLKGNSTYQSIEALIGELSKLGFSYLLGRGIGKAVGGSKLNLSYPHPTKGY